MSQSCFSLGFLSQNYFWKLSTLRGYKGIYIRVREEHEKSVFIQTRYSVDLASRLERVASLSPELTTWTDCTFCPVVLQLLWPFSSLHASHVCHFGDLPVTRLLYVHTSWVFCTHLEFSSHSLTHYSYIIPT